MKTFNGKQLFIRFLKQNNAYEQYVINFNSIEGYEYRRYLNLYSSNDFFKHENMLHFTGYPFVWNKTKEGWLYWEIIDEKWVKYVNTKKYGKTKTYLNTFFK